MVGVYFPDICMGEGVYPLYPGHTRYHIFHVQQRKLCNSCVAGSGMRNVYTLVKSML